MTRVSGSLAFASLLGWSGMAFAQLEPLPVPPDPVPAPTVTPAPEPAPLPPEPMLTTEPAPAEPIDEAAAEEEEAAPLPTIAGYVEAAYHLNLNDPSLAPVLRSYDSFSGNTFLLHSAHLVVAHSFTDEVSATIEMDAGSDPVITEALAGAAYAFDIQEAYAKYAKGGFALTAGKFVTYAGTEVIEGPLNPTLTRGFLFGLAEAFTHVGLKAHYTTDGGVDIGIGVVNGWDLWVDNNDWKTIIARVGYAGEKFFVGLSGSFGSEQTNDEDPRLSLDLTGGIIAGAVTINFQGNFGSEGDASWYGFGVQPLYTGDVFTFGARVEYFGDPDGVRSLIEGVTDLSYLNITLTPGVMLAEHFALRLELRADLALGGEPTKDYLSDAKSSQFTTGIGASYIF
jgi:hypothetical protein